MLSREDNADDSDYQPDERELPVARSNNAIADGFGNCVPDCEASDCVGGGDGGVEADVVEVDGDGYGHGDSYVDVGFDIKSNHHGLKLGTSSPKLLVHRKGGHHGLEPGTSSRLVCCGSTK